MEKFPIQLQIEINKIFKNIILESKNIDSLLSIQKKLTINMQTNP